MNMPHPTHIVSLYFTSGDYITPARDGVLFEITDLVAKVLGVEVHSMEPSISIAHARATLPLIVPPNKMDNLMALLGGLSKKLVDEGKLDHYEIKPATT